jgi:hypothetical protein
MFGNRVPALLALVLLFSIAACGREPVAPTLRATASAPSFAASASPQFFPFNFPAFPACTELVDVTGVFHPVFRTHSDGNGGFHFKGHFNATGIGIGLTSGAIYNWNDAINAEDNFRAPQETFTSQQSLELIGRSQADNFRLRFLFHVTVTPNGVVNITADNFTVDCN